MTSKKSLFKTRMGLIAAVSAFVISPILALMFYKGMFGDGFTPGVGKNYGELVHPARPLGNIRLQDPDGKIVTQQGFLGLWSLVEIAADPCIDQCRKNVYEMRQIRLALGKDAHRVQRVVLTSNLAGMADIIADNPGTVLLQIIDGSEAMLSQFPGYREGGIASVSGRIYIVDPQGNLMMRYPSKADPSRVLKDLRQLLKATWIRPKT